jgi:hypothetical protein
MILLFWLITSAESSMLPAGVALADSFYATPLEKVKKVPVADFATTIGWL